MPDRTDYQYNSYLGQQALDKLSVQGLMDRESSNRMFHTEIRIYEDGAFDATTEMFDEDKFIMSFEN